MNRIERTLKPLADPVDPSVSFYLALAIDHLRQRQYSDGEFLTSKAEEPHVWPLKGTVPAALSVAELQAALERAKAVDVIEV